MPKVSRFFFSDVDECTIENGGCADICVNTPGGMHCECGPTKALVLNSTTECEGITQELG